MYGLENIIYLPLSVNANITIHYQIEGGAFRSEEFIQKTRGAPCPKEFTLSAKERGKKYDRLTMMMMMVVRIKFK
jgi:hypothetical protein